MFYRVNNNYIQMPCSSLKNKGQKNEEHLSSVNFALNGNTKYSQYIKYFKQKVKQGPFCRT